MPPGKLIYLLNASLDGYVETPDHSLDWTKVDDQLHTWFNDQIRGLDALIYGRRTYELMASYWPTAESDVAATAPVREFARLWCALPKIVLSRSLGTVEGNSRLLRDGVGDAFTRIRQEFSGDLVVGGPTLAASFIERGLVDEYRLVVHPVILGAGTPFFPRLDRRVPLRLIETRRFDSGAVFLSFAAH